MALRDNFRPNARVQALAPTETPAMLRADVIAEVRANDDLAIELLPLMSRRRREADTRLAHDQTALVRRHPTADEIPAPVSQHPANLDKKRRGPTT